MLKSKRINTYFAISIIVITILELVLILKCDLIGLLLSILTILTMTGIAFLIGRGIGMFYSFSERFYFIAGKLFTICVYYGLVAMSFITCISLIFEFGYDQLPQIGNHRLLPHPSLILCVMAYGLKIQFDKAEAKFKSP